MVAEQSSIARLNCWVDSNYLARIQRASTSFGFSRIAVEKSAREAFKHLKHRLNVKHVSGLPQRAVAQDLAARVLCDNLQALTTLTAHACYELPTDASTALTYILCSSLCCHIPVARHRRSDLAGGRLGTHCTPYLPSSTRNLKATKTPLKTPQIHDAKTLLKICHFLTWVDCGNSRRRLGEVTCLRIRAGVLRP
jgi:hypothetical protein